MNLLGSREPDTYGKQDFESYLHQLRCDFPCVSIDFYQSNVEGELINKLQEVGFSYDGIILNAGGYTHTRVALHDCIKAITTPVVDVHISNIYAREEFRHKSLITSVCKGSVVGFGLDSYRLALTSFIS